MPSYNRLTGDNRIEIYALKKARLTQKAIAAQLNDQPRAGAKDRLARIPLETSAPIVLRRKGTEPPRIYRREKHSKGDPYDEETPYPSLSGRAA